MASTRGFAISAGGFSTLGSVLAASASAYDTSKWGTDYWIPVGENMAAVAGTGDPFSTTSLQIMAAEDGTDVSVDRTGDGLDDAFATINRGEVAHIDGGVRAGAHVRSTKPVQVHQSAGEAGSALRAALVHALPDAAADVRLPQPGRLQRRQPAHDHLSVQPGHVDDLRDGGLHRLSGSGIALLDHRQGRRVLRVHRSAKRCGSRARATPRSWPSARSARRVARRPGSAGDGSATYDWGFGLVPTNLLTTKAVLGWAPGNSTNPPSATPTDRDDDPVWISALADTNLFIDYDGNPATGHVGEHV